GTCASGARPPPYPRADLQRAAKKTRRQRVDAFGKFLPRPAYVMARRYQRLAIAPARRGLVEGAPDGVAQKRRVGDAADVAVDDVGQIGFSKNNIKYQRRNALRP